MYFDELRIEKGKSSIMLDTLANISEGYVKVGEEPYYVYRLSADKRVLKLFNQRERIIMAFLAGGSCSFASTNWEEAAIEGRRESVYKEMKETMGKHGYWKYVEGYLDCGLKPDHIVVSIDKNEDLDDTGKIAVSFITGKIYEILHGPSIDPKGTKKFIDTIIDLERKLKRGQN